MNNPILPERRPVEVLRTVHSLAPDPASAIHLHDNPDRDILGINTNV
jgi:hypothetical protein